MTVQSQSLSSAAFSRAGAIGSPEAAAGQPVDGELAHVDQRRALKPESIRYTERPAEAGIDTSVGSVGDSHDNALAEGIIGLFKTEVFKFLGPWKSAGQVKAA